MAIARSRAGFFQIDSAFPASAPGRHHIGPFEACSSFTRVTACQVARPPFCGLCREVPTRPVSQPSRSPAIESNHQLFEWVLPPLVICPFRAHAEACPTWTGKCEVILARTLRLEPQPQRELDRSRVCRGADASESWRSQHVSGRLEIRVI